MSINRPCAWCNDTSAKIDSIEYEMEQLEKENEHLRTLLRLTKENVPKYSVMYKAIEKAVKQ